MASQTRVRVEVFDHYFQAATEVIVEEPLFRKAITPLDFPDQRRDPTGISAVFCTPPATIKMVLNDRAILAKEISDAIAKQLIEFMSSQDTVMGYKVVKIKEGK